jgi:hypothetical protein
MKTSITIDKPALAVAGVVDKDEFREALKGVLLKDGRATAADGFSLVVADLPAQERFAGMLMPAKGLTEAVKDLKLGVRGTATIERDPSDELPPLVVKQDGEEPQGVPVDEMSATYPNANHVVDIIKSRDPESVVALDVDRLITLLKAIKAFGPEHGLIRLALRGETTAIEVSAKRPDGRGIEGYLMPMVTGVDY